MTWMTFALLSLFFYSFATIIQRKLMIDDSKSPALFMVFFQLIVSAMIGVYLLVFQIRFPSIWAVLPNLLINGLLISVASLFSFSAVNYSAASDYSIISTISTLVNLVMATILLKEPFTIIKIVGTLLISLAILILTFDRKSSFLNLHKGHLHALISAIFFGLAFSNESYIVGEIGVMQNLFIGFGLPGIMVGVTQIKKLKNIREYLDFHSLRDITLYSLIYLFGAVTLFQAYAIGGEAGKIYSISSASVILTVLLAGIFLKERDKPVRKLLATVTAFVGVLILR